MQTNIQHEESYEVNSRLAHIVWNDDFYDIHIDTLKKWIDQPMLYNKQIRDISRKLYNSNGIYTNVIDYTVAIPTLDRVVYSYDKQSENYQANKKKFIEALRIFKDKIVTRDLLFKLALEGIAFAYFETNMADPIEREFLNDDMVNNMVSINQSQGFNCSVVSLPTDYCSIVGIKNSSYVIAFDMQYFDQFIGKGLSKKLRSYPKEIREKYKKYRRNPNSYRWAVLDNNKTIVVKVRSKRDERWGRPLGLAAYVNMLYDAYFTSTKRKVLDDVNNTIIYQTFPEGERKGESSLTLTQQEKQHENIKRALFTKNRRGGGISFFSIAAGTKLDKLKTDVDVLKTGSESELIKRIATDLGFAGSALNGEDSNYSSQQMNIELVTKEVLTWLEQIEEEYNKVINVNIIKDPNCYMQLYYIPTTIANKDRFVGHMKDLYAMGKGSLQMWIAATGVNPQAYLALMDEELEEDFENKYPLHKTSYTHTEKTGGRPSIDNPDNDNTIKAKTNHNPVRPS